MMSKTADDTESPPGHLEALQSAAIEYVRAETARITQVVVAELTARPPVGIFPETVSRHLWDEYCWAQQDGASDDTFIMGGVSFGSITSASEDMIRAHIQTHIEALPQHAQVLLSIYAIENEDDPDSGLLPGCVWIDGMVDLVLDVVDRDAFNRNLVMIGPDRAEIFIYEISGDGIVWSAVDETGGANDIVLPHLDEIIDKDGDLSEAANDLIEAFMAAADDAASATILIDFFDVFGTGIRDMLQESVVETLEDMRWQIWKMLDG